MKIAHVINPVVVPRSSDLHAAQPITFAAMAAAAACSTGIEVQLLATCYEQDHAIVPEGFDLLPDLTRSVLDCGTFQSPRRLPLISEILQRAADHAPTADYIIYTNVDIAPMPYFYTAVGTMLASTKAGLIINRRTVIPEVAAEPMNMPHFYAAAGAKHPGYDCFVLPARIVPDLTLADTCIGAPFVGKVLYANMALHCSPFRVLEDAHLTFHLGDDMAWRTNSNAEYWNHNRAQLATVLATLENAFGHLDRRSRPGTFFKDTMVSRPRIILGQILRTILGRRGGNR